jgi:hypothetical protein
MPTGCRYPLGGASSWTRWLSAKKTEPARSFGISAPTAAGPGSWGRLEWGGLGSLRHTWRRRAGEIRQEYDEKEQRED